MSHTPGPWKAIRIGGELTGSVFAGTKRICYGICDYVRLAKEAEANSALIEAAPDMLHALEEVMGELDVEGLPCPLCGRDLTIGHRHNCIWHVVESAVRKARGEE